MELSFAALAGNLIAPTILFFILGLVAAFAKSDLSIPDGAAKVMSIYLLLAIGFKGGAAVAESGVNVTLIASLIAGILLFYTAFHCVCTYPRDDTVGQFKCLCSCRALWIDFHRNFCHGSQLDRSARNHSRGVFGCRCSSDGSSRNYVGAMDGGPHTKHAGF